MPTLDTEKISLIYSTQLPISDTILSRDQTGSKVLVYLCLKAIRIRDGKNYTALAVSACGLQMAMVHPKGKINIDLKRTKQKYRIGRY